MADDPTTPVAVAGALAEWLREHLWTDGPWDGVGHGEGWHLVYESDWSVEDTAAPRDTAIVQTADGRVWHCTVGVTAVEQTVRTPAVGGES